MATDQVRQAVDPATAPDPTTVQRTCTKVRMVNGEQMKHQLLEEQGGNDEDVATASTGCSPGPASRYDLTRTGRRFQRWVKGGAAVGPRRSASWPGVRAGGQAAMAGVVRPAARCPPRWTLLG